MAIQTSVLEKDEIGQVFTPLKWATWLISRWNITEHWINGASICDPTAGEGVFAKALIRDAQRRGVTITDKLISRLHLIEMHESFLQSFATDVLNRFSVQIPSSILTSGDVLIKKPKRRFDILIGNPPWGNFTDLPSHYKEFLKPYFKEFGLVPDKKAVLLGSSRTDFSALILKSVILNLLNKNGEAFFFTPLSLFTGDDAHRGFRDFKSKGVNFSVKEVVEFVDEKVFEGIGTSYCAVHFRRDQEQQFPVPYIRRKSGSEEYYNASPLRVSTDLWRVASQSEASSNCCTIDVSLTPEQKPRQGVNSCGASSIFIFNDRPDYIDSNCLFPLATKEIWKNKDKTPIKWIFIPHNMRTGKPLAKEEVKEIEGYSYLLKHSHVLQQRKGTLINTSIKKGLWWALLGVGSYSFAPYKVVWQAYGKHTFDPTILSDIDGQPWQANQAMHAFIPCWSKSDAKRICASLKNPKIEMLLKELNGQGKCNFAQPGKIKKILSFDREVS